MSFHKLAAGYLMLQALGAIAWWCVLFLRPGIRAHFRADNAPDLTLTAFLLPDALLLIGGSILGAYALTTRRVWSSQALAALAGASAYAALYCWSLAVATSGDALLGAVLMSPVLVAPAFIAWKSARPGALS